MAGEFERKAVAYVRKHYPGHEPVYGTVTFQTDVGGGYDGSDIDANIDVTWTEKVAYPVKGGRELPGGTRDVRRTIEDRAFDYDLNGLITEIMELEDPGDG